MPKVVEVPGVGNVEFPDDMSDEQIGAALAKQHGAAKPPPAAVPPQSFADKAKAMLYRWSQAAPEAGAMIGGTLAAHPALSVPTFGASIPLGGALGSGAGELVKQLGNKAYGAPVKPDYAGAQVRGANDAMAGWLTGQALSGAMKGARMAMGGAQAPLADTVKETPFANLSGQSFQKLYEEAMQPSPRPMSAPVGDKLAAIGGKYATPELASSAVRGSKQLAALKGGVDADLAAVQAADKARNALGLESLMKGNVDKLADANRSALSAVDEALPPRFDQGSAADSALLSDKADLLSRFRKMQAGQAGVPGAAQLPDAAPAPTRIPHGTKLTTRLVGEPNTSAEVMTNKPAMQAIGNVKAIGQEQGVLGSAVGQGREDMIQPFLRHGYGPDLSADALTRDSSELSGLSASINRQRGGIQQAGPKSGWQRFIYDLGKRVEGPESTVFGLRPETPVQAALNNTPRLAELEALRRGFPAQNPVARSEALYGVGGSPTDGLKMLSDQPNYTPADAGGQASWQLIKSLLGGRQ